MVAARFDVLVGVVALFRASVAAGDVLVACHALRFVHFLLRHAFFFNPGPPKRLMSTHSGHFPQFQGKRLSCMCLEVHSIPKTKDAKEVLATNLPL